MKTQDEFINIFGVCPFEMVMKGHEFTDPEILKLTTNGGTTVETIMKRKT